MNEKTNTNNRCDDNLLDGVKTPWSESSKFKKQQCAMPAGVSHTSFNNLNSPYSKTVDINRKSVVEAGSWTNHSPDISPAGVVVPDQDLEMDSVGGNNGIGGKYG